MKNLLAVLMLMATLGAYGQAITRNVFTTNSNPVAPLANGGLGRIFGSNYTSALNTNSILVYNAGTAAVNGIYGFSNLDGGGIAYYTNASGLYIGFDMASQLGWIATNGATEIAGTWLYENTVFPNSKVSDGMLANQWENLGTDSPNPGVGGGTNPAPIMQFNQTFTASGSPITAYTNREVWLDPTNGVDSPGPPGQFNSFLTFTNMMTYCALHPGTTAHILGSNFVNIVFAGISLYPIPPGTVIVGSGVASSQIVFSTNSSSEPGIFLCDNAALKDVYVGAYVTIGGKNNRIDGCKVVGLIDSLFFVNAWTNFEAWNSEFDSGFDTINGADNITTSTSSTAEFHNCSFHALGSLPVNGANHSSTSVMRCCAVGANTFRFYGGSMEASGVSPGNTNGNNSCIQITGSSSQVYVSGVSFKYDQTNTTSGWAHAVTYLSAGSNTNAVFEFDGCIPQQNGTNDVAGGNIVQLGTQNGTNILGPISVNVITNSGTAASITLNNSSTIGFLGASFFTNVVTGIAGISSQATTHGSITATGWTNTSTAIIQGYWTATTGVSVTNFNGAGTAWSTNASLTGESVFFMLQPNAKIMAPSGLSGTWQAL